MLIEINFKIDSKSTWNSWLKLVELVADVCLACFVILKNVQK